MGIINIFFDELVSEYGKRLRSLNKNDITTAMIANYN